MYPGLSPDSDIEGASPVVYKNIPDPLEIRFEKRAGFLRIDFFPQGNSSGGLFEVINQKGKNFFIIVNRVTGRVEVKKDIESR